MPRLSDLVLAASLYGAVLFALFTVIGPEVMERGEAEAGVFLVLQLLDDAVLAGVGLAFGRLRFPGSLGGLGFRGAGKGWWLWGLGGGVVAAGAAWLTGAALLWGGWAAPVHPVETLVEGARGPRDILLILVAVTGPVAFGEEIFFRGFAYRLLRARVGRGLAMAATSLGFALIHGLAFAAWLPILPVGLVFSVLAERTGSLWPAVLGHAVVNAVAVLMQ